MTRITKHEYKQQHEPTHKDKRHKQAKQKKEMRRSTKTTDPHTTEMVSCFESPSSPKVTVQGMNNIHKTCLLAGALSRE